MLVTVYGVIKTMALCKEPIRLCMSPPSITHVRTYIAVRDGEPSGTQFLTQIGKRYPNHPLVTLTQMGGSHASFRWT